MPEVQIPVQIRLRGARAWVALCLLLSVLVGRDRAGRWAEAGVWRLARYRIGCGKWQRFTPEYLAEMGVRRKESP